MRVEDIIIDCLTFPIATGQEETRRDGIETIEAIREVKRRYPECRPRSACRTSPSASTRPPASCSTRCSSHECVKAGLDSAIVHAAKILPMARIPEEQREVALDLVYDRRARGLRPAAALPRAVRGRRRSSRRASPRRGAGRAAARRAARSGGSSTASATASRPTSTRRSTQRPALDIVNDTPARRA